MNASAAALALVFALDAREGGRESALAQARERALRSVPPAAAAAYLGAPFAGTHAYVLAPSAPAGPAALVRLENGGHEHRRPGPPDLDVLERSPAVDLAEEALDWAPAESRRELAVAVVMRALALDLGEPALARIRSRPSFARMTRLDELLGLLREYEKSRATHSSLRSFRARLEAALRPRLELAEDLVRAGDRPGALAALAAARASGSAERDRPREARVLRALRDRDGAKTALEAWAAAAPADGEPLVELAEMAAEAGDRAGAGALLSRARGLAAPPGAKARAEALETRLAEEALRAAYGHAAASKRDAALAELAAAARASATKARAARLYRELGADGEADALLDALLKASPRDPALLVERAEADAAGGRSEAAAAALDRALAASPGRDELRRAALVLQRLGRPERAAALLRRLAAEKPEAAVLADLGLCEHLAGRGAEALAALRRAIALDPQALAPYLTLAAVHAARGERAEERAVYEAAPRDGEPAALRPLVLEGLSRGGR